MCFFGDNLEKNRLNLIENRPNDGDKNTSTSTTPKKPKTYFYFLREKHCVGNLKNVKSTNGRFGFNLTN